MGNRLRRTDPSGSAWAAVTSNGGRNTNSTMSGGIVTGGSAGSRCQHNPAAMPTAANRIGAGVVSRRATSAVSRIRPSNTKAASMALIF